MERNAQLFYGVIVVLPPFCFVYLDVSGSCELVTAEVCMAEDVAGMLDVESMKRIFAGSRKEGMRGSEGKHEKCRLFWRVFVVCVSINQSLGQISRTLNHTDS